MVYSTTTGTLSEDEFQDQTNKEFQVTSYDGFQDLSNDDFGIQVMKSFEI